MHNIELGNKSSPKYESRFGFNIETCCGSIPQSNTWDNSWTVRKNITAKLLAFLYNLTDVCSFTVILRNEIGRTNCAYKR